VYQSIEMSRFAALVPFATSFRLERLIVNAARQLELQVSVVRSDNEPEGQEFELCWDTIDTIT